MQLHIPLPAPPLCSHLYRTPECHPPRSQISTARCCAPKLYPRQSKMVHNPRAGLARPAAREACVSKPSATSDRPWSSTAPPGEFRPYIPPEQTLAELDRKKHTSELQSPDHHGCRLLLEKKK